MSGPHPLVAFPTNETFADRLLTPDLSGASRRIVKTATAPQLGPSITLPAPADVARPRPRGGALTKPLAYCELVVAGAGGSIDARYPTMSVMSSMVRFSITGSISATCGPFRVPIFMSQS